MKNYVKTILVIGILTVQNSFALFENKEGMAVYKEKQAKTTELEQKKNAANKAQEDAFKEIQLVYANQIALSLVRDEKIVLEQQIRTFENKALVNKNFAEWMKAYKEKKSSKMAQSYLLMSLNEQKMVDEYKKAISVIANPKYSTLDQQFMVLNQQRKDLENARTVANQSYTTFSNQYLQSKKEAEEMELELYQCGEGDEVRLDQNSISSDKPNVKGPLIDVPTEDQDGLGVCYAAAAALLYRSVYPEDPLMSYVDIAMNFKGINDTKVDLENAINSGDICGALDAAKTKGFCPVDKNFIDSPDKSNWGSSEQSGAISMARNIINSFNGLNERNKKLMAAKGNEIVKVIQGIYDEKKPNALNEDGLVYSLNFLTKLREDLKDPNIFPSVPKEKVSAFLSFVNKFLLKTYYPYLKKNNPVRSDVAIDLFLQTIKGMPVYEEIFKAYNNANLISEVKDDNFSRAELLDFEKSVISMNEDFLKVVSHDCAECLGHTNKSNLVAFANNIYNSVKFMKDTDIDFSNLNSSIASLQKIVEPGCVDPANRFFSKPSYTCQNNFPPFKKNKSEIDKRKKWLRSKVLKDLYSDTPTGVGVGYCSYMLQEKSWHTDYQSDCAKKIIDDAGNERIEKGGHGSVIIGVRKNPEKNECEYLIQNSWGAGCSNYYDPKKCEKGKIWVGEEAMAGNITDLQSLKKDNAR
ncbi:MAG: hypothetical protein ACOYL6_16475 [Bacteriovoracaceae bacterium]